MKYYVASDVHGFYSELHQALEKAGFFSDTAPHKLVLLGDLFDRGKEAVEMQDFVLDLMEKNEVILIRGNHEDLFEMFIDQDNGGRLRHHVKNGTYGTALQLTGFNLEKTAANQRAFTEAARQTPLYHRIIPAMQNYHETRNYIFVHGWIPCDGDWLHGYRYDEDWRDAPDFKWDEARWYNGMVASEIIRADKTIVCGHWHASFGHARYEHKGSEFGDDADFTPYYGPGIIAIDACTAHSGFVNVLVIEDEPL